jgi:hypothetical protein
LLPLLDRKSKRRVNMAASISKTGIRSMDEYKLKTSIITLQNFRLEKDICSKKLLSAEICETTGAVANPKVDIFSRVC